MSSGTGNAGNSTVQGPMLEDFYEKAGILHPITIGTIAMLLLFAYLRLASNRTVAPMTLFDWIVSVGVGSTLAGIVNGNSLVRGLIGLFTLLGFQYGVSFLTSRFERRTSRALNSPALLIVFRGQMLRHVMVTHRISVAELNGSLRQRSVVSISQVEAVFIEPTGAFSVYLKSDLRDAGVDPCILLAVPAYQALVDKDDGKQGDSDASEREKRKQEEDAPDADMEKNKTAASRA